MTIKKVVVYGLGGLGKQVAHMLAGHREEFGIEIEGFCDKRKIQDFPYDSFLPEKLSEVDFDLIAVTSAKWWEGIKEELVSSYGIPKEKIVLFDHWLGGGEYYCNLCGHHVKTFLPGGAEWGAVFEEKKIIGGGRRENCVCPFCGSIDRHRWLQYILKTETDIYESGGRILHFAPEHEIEHKLRERNAEYITADIVERKADVAEDITHLTFHDEEFDWIICSHVMEHIVEEGKAFSELRRCLKKSGNIILSVPICWEQPTLEDERINTDQERLRYYGQEDHVRLYGNDLCRRLEEYGFKVAKYIADGQQNDEIKELGVISGDTIWILEKN